MSIERIKTAEYPRLVRLWNPSSYVCLHLSGEGETSDVNHSWLGFSSQADALRQRAKAQGIDWTIVRCSRNIHFGTLREHEL